MENNLLSEKYRPRKLGDIIGNKKAISEAKKWIMDFKKKKDNTKKMLLIGGSPGIGKTTFANLLLKEYDYDVIEFNSSDVRTQKLVKESLTKIVKNSNISRLKNGIEKVTGIIMDEIDGMSTGDRGGINELISIISPSKGKGRRKKDYQDKLVINNPVICICNNSTEKKITDLKKISYFIEFKKPSYYEMENLYNKIIEKENIIIKDDIKSALLFACQYDIRRLFNIIADIKLASKNNYSEDDWDNLCNNLSQKDLDVTLYDAVDKCLNNYKNIDTCLSYYEVDKNLVGMMIHENLPNHIESNIKDTQKKKLKCLENISEYLSIGDIFDNYIYNEQSWELFELCGAVKIAGSSSLINSLKKKKYREDTNILFTNILNKSTMHCIYYKNLLNVCRIFKSDVESTKIIVEYLLYNLLDINGDIDKSLKLFKFYSIELSDIDLLLKVSKNYKNKFTEKVKKKLIKRKIELEL